MAHWKGSLGETMTGEFGAVGEHDSNRSAILREAATYARQTERAAARLPYSPKCLPIAMALQWCARDAGLPTRLVVAIRNRSASLDFDPEALNLTDEDKYHAWVELDGIMLVGECERAEYMPVFGFQLPDTVMGQAFEQPG